MLITSRVLKAVTKEFVKDKGGVPFYGAIIDPVRSSIDDEGTITLIHKHKGKVLKTYELHEIGMPAEEVSQELQRLSTAKPKKAKKTDLAEAATSFDFSDKKKMIAIGASAVMLLGTLAPIVKLPIVGSINYVAGGRGDGVIIVVIALASAFFAATNKYKQLRYTGCTALTLMFFTLINFAGKMNEAHASLKELEGNPFAGLAHAAIGSVGLEWGWILLLSGALTIIASSSLMVNNGQLILPRESIILDKAYQWENIPVLTGSCFVISLVFALIANTFSAIT